MDAAAARLPNPPPGSAELVDRDLAGSLLPAAYDAHRSAHPGETSRNERFYYMDLGVVRYPSWGEMKPGSHVVVRDEQGLPIGIARYEIEERWEFGRPRSIVKSDLLVAANPTGAALLRQHLVSIDLVSEIRVEVRSVLDPLLSPSRPDVLHSDRGTAVTVQEVPGMTR